MIQNLHDALQYQKDSIISKSLLKNSAGNITFFAFDKDQSLSEHTAPFDAFIICVEGNLSITIDKNVYVLSQNDSIVLPSHIPHSVYATSQSKFVLTMLKA